MGAVYGPVQQRLLIPFLLLRFFAFLCLYGDLLLHCKKGGCSIGGKSDLDVRFLFCGFFGCVDKACVSQSTKNVLPIAKEYSHGFSHIVKFQK
jgi:hypothetical protein